MIENKKYIVWPGYVRSRTDGDKHYIGAQQLMMLYGVPQHDCVIAPPIADQSRQAAMRRKILDGIDGLVHLRPRQNGNYQLPK